ncbi:MAG: response regulator transcription factor [Bdellovibrionales bacterium]
MSRILVIEDDRIICEGLCQALRQQGYDVEWARDGESGLHKVRTFSPDLVILDIMMPEMDGFEVIAELRRGGNPIPVLVVSARMESKDKVKGLDLGADDYIPKPFDLNELLARVRRHLGRRAEHEQIFGSCVYLWKTRQLVRTRDRAFISLTPTERKLLEFLLRRDGQLISRDQILDGVWGRDYEGTDRTVDNLIVSLRKKIGPVHLVTERGLGYRFMTKP